MATSSSFNTLQRQRDSALLPSEQNAALQGLIRPHIESFNYLLDHGLARIPPGLDARDIVDTRGNRMKFWIGSIEVSKPILPDRVRAATKLIFPGECRERGVTYKGRMTIELCYSVNDGPVQTDTRQVGHLPIMVKSKRCNLYGLKPKQLVRRHEDAEELGGYFVCNGIEKLIRLLIVPRRHQILAITRPSFSRRGPNYSNFGASIRCVRADQTAQTITVHYLSDGDCTLRFSFRKREYIIPVVLILKAFTHASDRDIYEAIVQNAHENTFLTERVEAMLSKAKSFALHTRDQILAYLGSRFSVVLNLSDTLTDVQLGEELIRKIIFVHLDNNKDKFNLLVCMIQKLMALVAGDCAADNPDSAMNHEILLPGHLFQMFIKEKLDDLLTGIKAQIAKDMRSSSTTVDLVDLRYFRTALGKVNYDIGRKLEYLLATGNLVTLSGLDLQQVSGYTIVAEKLNFLRYLSHFRSVHRGAFFAEIRTTTVRKLLPESWVHTPDGAPCGLLNHLTHMCEVVNEESDTSSLPGLLVSLGMTPISAGSFEPIHLPVILEGRVVGRCVAATAQQIAANLRILKCKKEAGVPQTLEIGWVPPSQGGQFSGLFLFSGVARMVRPVKNIAMDTTEMIGSYEQVYMDIACVPQDIYPGVTTHIEFTPVNMLSVVANITPFSDFNQSPRNMYQCQMAKQSMGTPAHSFPYRSDNKLYRLMFPQSPIVRPVLYDHYGFDNYPNGMNAVVAVIAYTGYDMEDAMILNKSSFERGFGHGMIYKTEIADLAEYRVKNEPINHRFGVRDRREVHGKLDQDGLPFVGTRLEDGDPLYSVLDEVTGRTHIEKYKSPDPAYVEEVRLIGNDTGDEMLQKVSIMLRIPRQPTIGDKFSSRHGQKGVCSIKWPAVDMPFSESGMTPDVIINPNAFPSRMTIGMLVESMAGKAGALHAVCQDATPFKFNEKQRAVDYFGEQLLAAGYNYYGNEPMYSGITGTEFHADIYLGVVYYQRLRHMVSDKFQVRTTGPVHNLTQQPVKGRKRQGGIRFGEMERDSLLAHGVSFMLQDRLMNCSDYSQTFVCRLCGSIISPISIAPTSVSAKRQITCRNCETSRGIEMIPIPYVFRYLTTELSAMNIKLVLKVE